MRCPNCSFVNPDGMRFCGRCGSFLLATQLAEQPHPEPIPPQLVSKILSQVKSLEGERRKVTVLFADISGYTSISEEMDPEDLASFANQVYKRLGSVIYRYEGIIDKYMGDCVMAIFGAPVTHENDPERALRATLDMMEEVKGMARPISLHVGVNSGEVIAGKIGSDLKMDYTVMGDTVNLAERLTGAAPPGEIYVSSTTYRLTRHAFYFEELRPLALKGKREKTVAFRLVEAKDEPERTRGVPCLTPHFLGRDEELDTLRQNLDRVKEGASRTIFVLGEAGVGKSRLIGEFKKSSADNATWLEGRCSSYTATSQFFPFVHLLEEALYSNSGDDHPDQETRALEKIKTLFPDRWRDVAAPVARILPLKLKKEIAEAIRYLDPKTLRVMTFVAVRDLLEALSQIRPVVVAIDDIHWADESSQDLMRFLIENTTESYIMIIGVTRPTPGSRWELIHKETTRKLPARTDTINLKALSREDMEELIDLLLEKPSINPETRLGILQKSGGSPFYLEEIIKDLIEGNVLSKKEDGWVCSAQGERVPIPETVEAVIASRIDKLTSRGRSLLRCASVFGTNFTYDDLVCVAGKTNAFESELAELIRSDLISEPVSPKREYSFAHTLIQEVAHGTILKSSRRELHLKAARCIEQRHAGSLDRYFGALGNHYETGGNLSKAFSYYLKAGTKARESFANSEAVSNLSKALAIEFNGETARSTIRERISAMIDRAMVHRLRGKTDLALTDFEEALKLSREQGEMKFEADSLIGLSQTYGWTSRFPEMEDASRQALDLYRRVDDREGESKSLSQLGYARQIKGEYDAAIDLYTESLGKSAAVDNRLEQSNCLNNLGAAYCSQGDLDKGLAYFEESLEIKREIGDLEGEAANLHNLGYIKLTMGKKAEALDLYTASLNLKERIGDRAGAAVTLNSLGTVYIGMGKYDTGLEYCRRALEAREEVGDKRGQGYTLQNMSRVLTMTGPLEDAIGTLKQSLAIMEEVNDKEGQALVLTSLGRICTDSQDYEAGQAYLDRARSIAREIGATRVLFKVESELALRALLAGPQSEAEELGSLVASRTAGSSTPETKAVSLWLRAGLEATRGHLSRAATDLGLAKEAAAESVDRAITARWTFHIGRILRSAGAAALSKGEVECSTEIFRELGAGLWLERARNEAIESQ